MGFKTSFYITEEFSKLIEKYSKRYGSVSKAINNIFCSVDTIYRIERKVLRETFSKDEISYLIYISKGTIFIPQAITGIIISIIPVIWPGKMKTDISGLSAVPMM